jgi:glycosyltransferase involved in cell wall biosynthesis
MTRTPARYAVAHVVPSYPPRLGGMERVAQAMAEHLAARHDVEVLTTSSGAAGSPRRERHGGLTVRRYAALDVAHTPLSPGLALRLLTLPRSTIVHAHVANAFLPETVWLGSWLRGRPYVLHFHLDVDATGRLGRLLPAYKRRVLGPVLRRAARVIALSAAQAEFLVDRYGVDRERVVVIPNGVAGTGFRTAGPEPARQPGEPLRLLFVGRLDAQKNVSRLVDAVRAVPSPVELVVVGDGEQRELVERRAAGLPNVRLVGAHTGDGLQRWYRWAEAFVLASDREGMPLVLLEAMAAGLALVSTDVPGSREVVQDVGLLAEPTAEALGAAIERLASDRDLLARLAARSVAQAPRYSWGERIAELESVYDGVAAEHTATGSVATGRTARV